MVTIETFEKDGFTGLANVTTSHGGTYQNGSYQNGYYQYEYPEPEKLTGDSYFILRIPSNIILDTSIDAKRLAALTFFMVRKGMDNQIVFSINNIVHWSGAIPDRHKGAINSKYLNTVNQLADRGYLTYSGDLKITSYTEGVYNREKMENDCSQYKFATLYLDEIINILQYKKLNKSDAYLNNAVLLLVFAYLRLIIPKRSNAFRKDESLENRRNSYPEAYDCYYFEIANDLGITAKTASKAVNVLSSMGLIYAESLPRIYYKDKWRTDHTIFCNMYKRESHNLLAYGEQYFKSEISRKKAKLKIGINDKNVNDNRKGET